MDRVIFLLLSFFCLSSGLGGEPFISHMSASCAKDHYSLQINYREPFFGRIFSKGFRECSVDGNGSLSLRLFVNKDCGGLLSSLEPGRTDQFYIQRDPSLQQAEDEVVEIHCGEGSKPESLIRFNGNDSLFYTNLQTTFEVNETKDVGREEKDDNEIDSEGPPVYIQAWMDIFSSGMDDDYFYVGQKVFLSIKWKDPKTPIQPKVGACRASSGQRESLRLRDETGASLQKIFPSNFTYSTSKSGITTAKASFLMFKFASSDRLLLSCTLIFPASRVPIRLEATAEDIHDQGRREGEKAPSLNQAGAPSHYLRSDDLSAQEAKRETHSITRDFPEEPQVCMSRLRMVLAFGVLILVLFIALVFSCMLWSRAKAFTNSLNNSSGGGLFTRRRHPHLKRLPGPYVIPSGSPYR